jgi:hypothetical protein
LFVPGNHFHKHLHDNLIGIKSEVGQELFDSFGLGIHRILSHAATTVAYKDIFNDTE